MKILGATQIKEIQVTDDSFIFPIGSDTKLILDKKGPSNKKEHQLIYQQGSQYGQVGDYCTYLTNDELFELEQKGMIKIRKSGF